MVWKGSSPPPKRRWLLRAERASADTCPIDSVNSVTTRSASRKGVRRSTSAGVMWLFFARLTLPRALLG